MCLLILGLGPSQSEARSIENTNICRLLGGPQAVENHLEKSLFHLVQSLTMAKYYVTEIKEKFMSSRIQSSQYPVVECARNTLNFNTDNRVNTNSVKEDMNTLLAVRWVIDEMRRSETDLFYIDVLNNLKIAVNNALSSLEKILLLFEVHPVGSSLHLSLCSSEGLEERYFRDFTLLAQIETLISRRERKYIRCRMDSIQEVQN